MSLDNRAFYLIMEDLSDDYTMKNTPEGLNFDQMNDCLVKLAQFHAVAFAFNLENPQAVKQWGLTSWYEKFLKDEEFIQQMEKCFDSLIKDLSKVNSNVIYCGPAQV